MNIDEIKIIKYPRFFIKHTGLNRKQKRTIRKKNGLSNSKGRPSYLGYWYQY